MTRFFTYSLSSRIGFKYDTLNTEQFQDYICNVTCMQPVKFQCTKCEVGLCMHLWFRKYSTELPFWITSSLHRGKETTSKKCVICFITI